MPKLRRIKGEVKVLFWLYANYDKWAGVRNPPIVMLKALNHLFK